MANNRNEHEDVENDDDETANAFQDEQNVCDYWRVDEY